MKKKLLSLAVVSALGSAGIAQAVHVNPDGLGQVLLYPFYSVEGNGDTYVSITNTTSVGKAVKVRFLEAMNSQEVLDFNLYLSPKDIWTGVVTANPDGEGAVLRTADTSCTVPAIPEGGVAFRNFEYLADSENGVDRTREGYVEIIEMGEVVANPALGWITHNDSGVPANCAAVRARWNGGEWVGNPTLDLATPGGGLYGFGVLINVPDGTDATYDATALDNFSDIIQHTNPGSTLPSLASAQPPIADILDGNQIVSAFFDEGIDAVSALFMHNRIANDYVLAPEISAGTDWLLNFPTKRFYTNLEFIAGVSTFRAPFTAGWNRNTSRACEPFSITYYDREEQAEIGELDFSPLPPEQVSSLCWEANVVTFNNSDVLYSQRVRTNLDVIFDNGWAEFDFSGASRQLVDLDGTVFNGLPVVGFAVQNYVNGDVGGLLSNYSGLINHKGTRSILVAD